MINNNNNNKKHFLFMLQCKVSLKDGISCKSCWIGNGSLKMEGDLGDVNISEKEEKISSLWDS